MRHLKNHELLGSTAIVQKGEDDDPADIVTKAVEDLTKTVDERLEEVEKKADTTKLLERLDKLEAKANRPGTGDDRREDDPSEERKAFAAYLRRGGKLPEEELKALTVANDEEAGYLAPAEMSTEFIRDLVEFSPVRFVASVRNIASPSVKYPKRTGTNAQWEGETEEAEESTVTFGQLEVPARKLMTYVDISNELLADSGGTVEAEVRLALAEDFGQKESIAFLHGDGAKQPEGLMTHAVR